MAPDGSLQHWETVLENRSSNIPQVVGPHSTNIADTSDTMQGITTPKTRDRSKWKGNQRKKKKKKRKNKTKNKMITAMTFMDWKSPCPDHLPEKVFPTGQRDNGESYWRCSVCK